MYILPLTIAYARFSNREASLKSVVGRQFLQQAVESFDRHAVETDYTHLKAECRANAVILRDLLRGCTLS